MVRTGAFTLLETAIALALLSVMAVSLLSLSPIGLRETEASLLETRAMFTAQTLFTTLRSTPFTAADCFGKTVDLSAVSEATAPLVFFVSDEESRVTTTEEADSRYRLAIAFRIPPRMPSGVEARQVIVRMAPLHRDDPSTVFQTVIATAQP